MNIRQRKPAGGRGAAALMAAAGVLVACALGTASPAYAADTYISLAYQLPSLGQGEFSGVGISSSFDGAIASALADCKKNGGNTADFLCESYVVATNECAAFSILNSNWSTATGPSRQAAEERALQQNPGSHIGVSGCAVSLPTKGGLPRPTLVPRAPA